MNSIHREKFLKSDLAIAEATTEYIVNSAEANYVPRALRARQSKSNEKKELGKIIYPPQTY